MQDGVALNSFFFLKFFAVGGAKVHVHPPSPPAVGCPQAKARRFANQAQIDSCLLKQQALNRVARIVQVTALCRQNAKSLALDLGVVLHGEVAGELPECVLGVLRIEGLDLQDTSRHRLLWES